FGGTVYAAVISATSNKIVSLSTDASTWAPTSFTTADDTARVLKNASTESAMYVGTSQTQGLVHKTTDALTWPVAFASGQNYTSSFETFDNGRGPRLYVAIAGPNFNVVDGGQAYLYKATFS
ncbi:MAG: hypothetical protein AB1626_04830, partial [Candidatus Micrarchaeota archaeon]